MSHLIGEARVTGSSLSENDSFNILFCNFSPKPLIIWVTQVYLSWRWWFLVSITFMLLTMNLV